MQLGSDQAETEPFLLSLVETKAKVFLRPECCRENTSECLAKEIFALITSKTLLSGFGEVSVT